MVPFFEYVPDLSDGPTLGFPEGTTPGERAKVSSRAAHVEGRQAKSAIPAGRRATTTSGGDSKNEIAHALRLQAQALTAVADVLEAGAASSSANDGTTLLTARELAAILRVSVDTISRFAKDGAPFVLVGARRRYREGAVREWLATRSRPAREDGAPIVLRRR